MANPGLERVTLYGLCAAILFQQTIAAVCSSNSDYTEKTQGCYKAYQNTVMMTPDEAEARCQEDDTDSHLASARSQADNTLYQGLFPADATRIMLGLTRAQAPHPSWYYISDGKPVQNQGCYEYKSSNTDFSHFAVAAPIGGVTYQTCINYCQGKSTPYAYAAVTGGPDTFSCGCARADFSRDKQFDLLANSGGMGCINVCAGSTDYCGYTDFLVVLDFVGVGYDSWAKNQPNNFGGYQECAALSVFKGEKYIDERCAERYPYICQDADGVKHAHNSSSDYLSWFNARKECKLSYTGGDLATFNDAGEMAGIYSTSSSSALTYWIGLTNAVWEWRNGIALDWSNWDMGEPALKDNRCTYMIQSSGIWSDVACTENYNNFVCEIYVPAATTTAEPLTTSGTDVTTADFNTNTDNNNNNNNEITDNSNTVNGGGISITPGASTNQSSSLSMLDIILIAVSILFFILVIILIIVVCYYKRKNNRKNKIHEYARDEYASRGPRDYDDRRRDDYDSRRRDDYDSRRGTGGYDSRRGTGYDSRRTSEYESREREDRRRNEYDARRGADVPYSGPIGDEVFLPANATVSSPGNNSDNSTATVSGAEADKDGSHTDLIKNKKSNRPSSRKDPEGRMRVDVNERY